MLRFRPAERRSLGLATALLVLASAGRVMFAPEASELAWRPAATDRPSESVGAVRQAVDDTLVKQAEAGRPLGPGETVDLNRADAVQLQRLPGIGPGRAAAILAERSEFGDFAAPEELVRVPGIGPVLAQRLRGLVRTDAAQPRRLSPARPGVDLNRAQPNELEQITGIGPALARRIVAVRTRRGRFSSFDDLLEVPGIGPKTLEKLREQAFVR